ncbi:MAG: tetratricopeptide repeat protein, partial [candidate division Zixibacteria bacterium]|nr:tetratricopeptide repeat protein [candidate division Zixibacteria bacterium]
MIIAVGLGSVSEAADPADIKDQLARGRNLFEAGNLERAIAVFESVDSLAPGTPSVHQLLLTAYRYLGIDYYGQSRCEEAVAVWRKALALDPENRELPRYIHRCETELSGIAR